MTGPLDERSTQSISREGLSSAALARELHALGPRWSIEGGALRLALAGPMSRMAAVASFAATIADELDHHPHIAIERSGLRISISTPGAGATTVHDLVFAARLELWLRTNGWPT